MEIEEKKTEQKDYVKLSKMSKGYNWEIKILAVDQEVGFGVGELNRIESIDERLRLKYGDAIQ